VILAITPYDQLEPMVSGHNELILAGGHTHTQMLRRYRAQVVVNPGSVGLPVERLPASDRRPPWAEYAVINWQDGLLGVELRRVPLDVNDVIQAALQSDMPHAEWWAADWG
jgi:diadenosine tetraphosphatase ApaH/serine/threonine PP2A family protein phosphatase